MSGCLTARARQQRECWQCAVCTSALAPTHGPLGTQIAWVMWLTHQSASQGFASHVTRLAQSAYCMRSLTPPPFLTTRSSARPCSTNPYTPQVPSPPCAAAAAPFCGLCQPQSASCTSPSALLPLIMTLTGAARLRGSYQTFFVKLCCNLVGAQMTAGRVSEDTRRSGPAKASLSRRRPSAPRSVISLSSVSVNSLMLTSSTSVSGAPATLSGTPARGGHRQGVH